MYFWCYRNAFLMVLNTFLIEGGGLEDELKNKTNPGQRWSWSWGWALKIKKANETINGQNSLLEILVSFWIEYTLAKKKILWGPLSYKPI